jgi:excisionase family DNA binding protein
MGRAEGQTPLPRPARRWLSREEAADYVGVSPSLFDRMVEDGRMPQPKPVNARLVWDRYRLDEAFERLPDRAGEQDTASAGGFWSGVAA